MLTELRTRLRVALHVLRTGEVPFGARLSYGEGFRAGRSSLTFAKDLPDKPFTMYSVSKLDAPLLHGDGPKHGRAFNKAKG